MVNWPKTNVISVKIYLMNSQYEIEVHSAKSFQRKICKDTIYVCCSQKCVALDERSKFSLIFYQTVVSL